MHTGVFFETTWYFAATLSDCCDDHFKILSQQIYELIAEISGRLLLHECTYHYFYYEIGDSTVRPTTLV